MPTPNRNYALGTVGGSPNTWGTETNAALGEPGNDIAGPTPPLASPNIDEDMQAALDLAAKADADAAAAQARADACVLRSGAEVVLGRLSLDEGSSVFAVQNPAAGPGGVNVDVSRDATILSLTGAITITFTNLPALVANNLQAILIEITGNGFVVTWPGGILWNMGVVPVQTAGQDTYVLYRVAGGPWIGTQAIVSAA